MPNPSAPMQLEISTKVSLFQWAYFCLGRLVVAKPFLRRPLKLEIARSMYRPMPVSGRCSSGNSQSEWCQLHCCEGNCAAVSHHFHHSRSVEQSPAHSRVDRSGPDHVVELPAHFVRVRHLGNPTCLWLRQGQVTGNTQPCRLQDPPMTLTSGRIAGLCQRIHESFRMSTWAVI